MSLSRAFTSRRLWPHNGSEEKTPALRRNISGPVQLIHTTNMLSYSAPDLPRSQRNNSVSAKFDEDSDAPTAAESTPPTSPDVAPGEQPSPPEPNHLTSYFRNAGKPFSSAQVPPPAIPKRSPSHTKPNHYDLAYRSSMSRPSREVDMSPSVPVYASNRPPSVSGRVPTPSMPSSPLVKKNAPLPPLPMPGTVSPPTAIPSNETHPFGRELAQVSELAEEYSAQGRVAIMDEELQYLESRGLVRLSVSDYLGAVQSISTAFFPEENRTAAAAAPLWI